MSRASGNQQFTGPGSLLAITLCTLFFTCPVTAAVTVTDDSGVTVSLEQPAARIISLAPHLTELLFSAGAGDRIVGTVRYSNFPAGAGSLPVIGDVYRLDLEAIIAMQPDLVVAWQSYAVQEIERLRSLQIPVYISASDTLGNIASTITQLGLLAGTDTVARSTRAEFSNGIAELSNRYSTLSPVTVFYQFWHDPIYTVNSKHVISEVMGLCGGSNVFADIPSVAGKVSTEAVISADPQVILASGVDETRPAWLDEWQAWPQLSAVSRGQLYVIPPDLLQRPSARILEGARMACEYIDRSRSPGR